MRMEKSRVGKYVLPIFIVAVLVASTFGVLIGGFGDSDGEEYYKHNGHLFRKADGKWLVNVNGQNVFLTFGVRELSDIDIEGAEKIGAFVERMRNSNKAYLSFEQNKGLFNGPNEVYSNIKPVFVNLFLACPEDIEECSDLPVKNCGDAGDDVSVIVMRAGEFKVEQKDGCLEISGEESDVTRVADLLVLEFFDVV